MHPSVPGPVHNAMLSGRALCGVWGGRSSPDAASSLRSPRPTAGADCHVAGPCDCKVVGRVDCPVDAANGDADGWRMGGG